MTIRIGNEASACNCTQSFFEHLICWKNPMISLGTAPCGFAPASCGVSVADGANQV